MKLTRILNFKNFVLFILFASVFFFSFAMLNNNVLCYDDVILLSDSTASGLKAHLENINYGTWVLQAENVLLFYLPYKLGFNIQDWACSFGGIIKALVVSGFGVVFYNFIKTEKLPLKISLPFVLFFFFLYVILIFKTSNIDLTIYHGFFRFVFSSLLMTVFTFMYYKLFVYKKCNLFVILPFSVITAASSEVTAAILLSMVFISVITKIFWNKYRHSNHNLNLKNDFLIFLCLCTGLILLCISSGFQVHLDNSSKIQGFRDYVNLFCPFVKMFVKTIILNYIWIYICCIISYLLILKKSTTKIAVRKITFSIISVLSVWTFAFSLILMGKGSRGGSFWLDHPDIYSILIPLLIIAVIIPVGFVFHKYLVKAEHIITALLIGGLLLTYQPLIISYKNMNSILNTIKVLAYTRDKMLAFCYYNNFSLPQSDIIDYMYISIEDINPENTDKPICKIDDMDFFHDVLNDSYMPFIYGIKEPETSKKIYGIITLKDTAQYLKSKGFTIDETKSGKYKFSDIKNKNFVMNKK